MKKLTEKQKISLIKDAISGMSQADCAKKYGYSGRQGVSAAVKKFKAIITDYLANHTLEETLDNYADYGVTKEWLVENDIQFSEQKPLNKKEVTQTYRNGANIYEIMEIYDVPEDEVRKILTTSHIEIREDRIPNLITGDIVWVKGGKFMDNRAEHPNAKPRTALVVMPQYVLDRMTTVTVIWGTTVPTTAPDKAHFVTNKYYTGKETYFNFSEIEKIDKSEILPPNSADGKFAHLNPSDYAQLRNKLGNYFGDRYIRPLMQNERAKVPTVEEKDIEAFIVELFEKGVDRNNIYELIKNTPYESDKSFIQSTLDRAGFSGVKSVTATPESETVQPEPELKAEAPNLAENAEIAEMVIQITEVKAKLSVYEKLFERVETLRL